MADGRDLTAGEKFAKAVFGPEAFDRYLARRRAEQELHRDETSG
jgi:hypothetical protein